MTSVNYKAAGVDREKGEAIKAAIKEAASGSCDQKVIRGLGLFSGFYALETKDLRQPVLVSSLDGVGTKVKIAQMMGKFDSLGEDLVNHCVNDIMVCGADPLFFLDYIAADRLEPQVVGDIIHGITRACTANGCALVGGETAEMPGVYAPENFDLAGAIVGLVEREAIIDGSKIKSGDVLLGAASNGLHTNGYSLARKILFDVKKIDPQKHISELGAPLGEELLKVHRSYRILIQKVRRLPGLHGIAHVTGGGIVDNTRRLLPENYAVRIDWGAWETPAIFKLIQKEGAVAAVEMRRVFNLGIGLVLIVDNRETQAFLTACKQAAEPAVVIGSIVQKE
jgi:phosphoribosylformylglycinamidine cyclo-ligase